MGCLVLPISILKRRCWVMGYQQLREEGPSVVLPEPVTVVVGAERKVLLVEPFVLEQSPFPILMESMVKKDGVLELNNGKGRVIHVDVDSISFEHMLWLINNDWPSLLKLNLKDIIDFYAQDS
ncbi:hypothetical protein Dimus_008281 [Dionaea muscipula]